MSGLRRKPKISIKGPRKAMRDASLIIIACEGEKTEAEYFSFSFLQNSRVKLVVVPSVNGESSPSHVIDNLEREASAYSLKKGDHLWVVCDVDTWNYEKQIKPLLNRKIGIVPVNLAFSNPCFELFLYLHFRKMPDVCIRSSKDMIQLLRDEMGSYSKVKLDEDRFVAGVQSAIMEAEKTDHSTDGIPCNPGTDVGVLVKTILEMKPKREK